MLMKDDEGGRGLSQKVMKDDEGGLETPKID